MTVRSAIAVSLIFLVWARVGGPAQAQGVLQDARDLKLFRVDLDNDMFVGSDDAFTAGWSVQLHSPLYDEWPANLGRWVGRVPALDAGLDDAQ